MERNIRFPNAGLDPLVSSWEVRLGRNGQLAMLDPRKIGLCVANGGGGADILARYSNARGGVWQRSRMVGKSE
jgi:hypothetical protein